VLQSVMRLVFAAVLVYAGWQAIGAILALPLASTAALALALALLLPYFQATLPAEAVRPISWRYSMYTLFGLLAFAVMTNVDAIAVRRFFGDLAAEAYGPVVTLGKINLFVPLGIGLVLFPKATQRHAVGRDARPVLLLALAATLLPGFLLTIAYFLWPGQIVELVFGDAYVNPGRVLGLVGLATTLYAGVNIWLNYALSLERHSYVLALVVVVLLQVAGMVVYHGRLETIAWLMVTAGLLANVAGAILLYYDSGEWLVASG
jgi:O-antigen/teichoic acid export membrane protein